MSFLLRVGFTDHVLFNVHTRQTLALDTHKKNNAVASVDADQ